MKGLAPQKKKKKQKVSHLSVREGDWEADGKGGQPGDEDDDPAVGLRPQGHGLDGVDHGQESVQRHEHQGVDAHEGGGDDQELDDLAPVLRGGSVELVYVIAMLTHTERSLYGTISKLGVLLKEQRGPRHTPHSNP